LIKLNTLVLIKDDHAMKCGCGKPDRDRKSITMNVPLFRRSIRLKLLVYVIGFIFALRLVMMLIEYRGDQVLIQRTISYLEETRPFASEAGHEKTLADLRARMREIKQTNMAREFVVSLGFFGLIVLAVMLMARSITRPIVTLTRTARELAGGHFDAARKLASNQPDEVGELSRAFAIMADNLKASRDELQHNMNELQAAERQLRLFFEQSADIMGIAGHDTNIIYVNPAFLNTLGYRNDEIIGRSYVDLVHPDDISHSLEAVAALGEGKNLDALENRFRARDGNYRRILWNVSSDLRSKLIYAAGRDITEERKLEEEVVRATTAEQERIARDLHDSVGQLVTGLAFKAKLIEAQLNDQTPPAPSQATDLVKLANRIGEQIRTLARGIDPVELQDGLAPALEYLAASTTATFHVQCTFKADPGIPSLEKSRAIHLYRIVQEAVGNAIKHSKARQINILLTHRNNEINLTVADNGCGMIRRPVPPDGSGLRIMRYRARMIGGTLEVQPRPDCGLLVKCTIQNSL
jgi:PAS domain S-box-containing protein